MKTPYAFFLIKATNSVSRKLIGIIIYTLQVMSHMVQKFFLHNTHNFFLSCSDRKQIHVPDIYKISYPTHIDAIGTYLRLYTHSHSSFPVKRSAHFHRSNRIVICFPPHSQEHCTSHPEIWYINILLSSYTATRLLFGDHSCHRWENASDSPLPLSQFQ